MAESRTPLRVVLLSGFRIFPTNTGGHLRTASVARALARMGHHVLIYSLAGRQSDYGLHSACGPHHERINHGLNLDEETNLGLGFGLLQAIFRRLGRPRRWQYMLLERGVVPRRLRRILHDADLVISDMPWVPKVAGPWQHKPWFMLSHNLEYRLLEQGDAKHRRAAPWMKTVETQATGQFRGIFACAEEDRDFFRAQAGMAAQHLPLIRCGVDPALYRAPRSVRERTRSELGLADGDRLLVFSGSGFAPNIEAAQVLREFCRNNTAFLVERRVYVLILGSVLSAPVREERLIGTGRVADVLPFFAAADAGLNAVERGSGANVKLFEYLAARLPIISTTFGVRGTNLVSEVDFIEYTPSTLGDAIQTFASRDVGQYWRDYAEAVWTRHRHEADIQEMVEAAVAQFPEFHSVASPRGFEPRFSP